MDNYIVRVYRRDVNDPDKIAGLVELVEAQEKKFFVNYDELREILGITGGKPDRRRRKGANGRPGKK